MILDIVYPFLYDHNFCGSGVSALYKLNYSSIDYTT
jgi:hypothetical protein